MNNYYNKYNSYNIRELDPNYIIPAADIQV